MRIAFFFLPFLAAGLVGGPAAWDAATLRPPALLGDPLPSPPDPAIVAEAARAATRCELRRTALAAAAESDGLLDAARPAPELPEAAGGPDSPRRAAWPVRWEATRRARALASELAVAERPNRRPADRIAKLEAVLRHADEANRAGTLGTPAFVAVVTRRRDAHAAEVDLASLADLARRAFAAGDYLACAAACRSHAGRRILGVEPDAEAVELETLERRATVQAAVSALPPTTQPADRLAVLTLLIADHAAWIDAAVGRGTLAADGPEAAALADARRESPGLRTTAAITAALAVSGGSPELRILHAAALAATASPADRRRLAVAVAEWTLELVPAAVPSPPADLREARDKQGRRLFGRFVETAPGRYRFHPAGTRPEGAGSDDGGNYRVVLERELEASPVRPRVAAVAQDYKAARARLSLAVGERAAWETFRDRCRDWATDLEADSGEAGLGPSDSARSVALEPFSPPVAEAARAAGWVLRSWETLGPLLADR